MARTNTNSGGSGTGISNANNGLSLSGSTVQLGGTLIQDTAITGDKNFSIRKDIDADTYFKSEISDTLEPLSTIFGMQISGVLNSSVNETTGDSIYTGLIKMPGVFFGLYSTVTDYTNGYIISSNAASRSVGAFYNLYVDNTVTDYGGQLSIIDNSVHIRVQKDHTRLNSLVYASDNDAGIHYRDITGVYSMTLALKSSGLNYNYSDSVDSNGMSLGVKDFRINSYENTRDDTGVTTPINFLYTDGSGNFKSGAISLLGLVGYTPSVGGYNTALGVDTAPEGTGYANTFIGNRAGKNIIGSGVPYSRNVLIGTSAGITATDLTTSVLVGNNADVISATGIGSATAIGNESRVASLATAIGAYAYAGYDSSIALGYLSNTLKANQMVIGSVSYPINEMVTYTDNTKNHAVLTRKITLTSAQLLALATTSIELVPVPDAGHIVQVLSAIGRLDFNSSPYVGSLNLSLVYNGSTTPVLSNNALFGSSAVEIETFDIPASNISLVPDASVHISNITGVNATGGDSPITIYITYKIIKLF